MTANFHGVTVCYVPTGNNANDANKHAPSLKKPLTVRVFMARADSGFFSFPASSFRKGFPMRIRSITILLAATTSLFFTSPLRAFDIDYTVEGELVLESGSDPLGLAGAGITAIYTIDSDTVPSSIQSNRTNYIGQATTVMISDPGGPADGTWQGTSPFIVPFRNPGQNNFLQLSDDLTVAGEDFRVGFFQIHFFTDDLFPSTGQIPLPLFGNSEIDFITTAVSYGDLNDPFGDSSMFSVANATAFSTPVPEPATFAPAVLSLIGFVSVRRSRVR